MKKIFYAILLLSFSWQLLFAQERNTSTGKIPSIKIGKTRTVVNQLDNQAIIAYGYSNYQSKTLSMPIPSGAPFTILSDWNSLSFASSMVKGSNGEYYITTKGSPAKLYRFNPINGSVTFLFYITGIFSGESVNGIAYNKVNGFYYLATSNSAFPYPDDRIYRLDINDGVATFIGDTGSGGKTIDIAITTSGICYGYDGVFNNAYTINLDYGIATFIGPLGFNTGGAGGMSIDNETGTVYITAYNSATATTQLRTLNTTTGNTTLIIDWGYEQIAAFALDTQYGPPCTVEQAINPNPANGMYVPVTLTQISWTNGSGTEENEIWFGPEGNVYKIYDGTAITQYTLPNLSAATTYYWEVVCKNDSCVSQGSGWNFTTGNFYGYTIDLHPLNYDYWTGTCNSSIKTENSLVKADGSPYTGWMVFNSSVLGTTQDIFIESIEFNGYVYNNNWPYWSITPMGTVNPISDSALAIYSQVSSNYQEGTAYGYYQESGTLTLDWITRTIEGSAKTDLKNSRARGWFAIGFYEWDVGTSYYIEFHGWAESNKPFLRVNYIPSIPIELISLEAVVNNDAVNLLWRTATETNNSGFEILKKKSEQRSQELEWETIGFVPGFGTTTEPKSYLFVDDDVITGKYKYRLKQIDYDGSFVYSQEIEVEVKAPFVFSLEQNYPNPFNPSTTIKYEIPEKSVIIIKVFDVLGNEVSTLVNEEKPAGEYEVEFDGGGLTSGIYFYKLQAGNYVETKKMILLK